MRQIRLKPGGPWHREAVNATDRTACGEVVEGAFASRDYELGLDLCEAGCWTRPERDTDDDLAAAAAAAREFEEGDTGVTGVPEALIGDVTLTGIGVPAYSSGGPRVPAPIALRCTCNSRAAEECTCGAWTS